MPHAAMTLALKHQDVENYYSKAGQASSETHDDPREVCLRQADETTKPKAVALTPTLMASSRHAEEHQEAVARKMTADGAAALSWNV